MDKSNLNTRNKKCTNCGDLPKGKVVKGLCPACRIFFRRNGRHRTKADMIRRKGERATLCANCKQTRASYRDLCSACYQYQQLNGEKRPSHLWREECRVCGRPKGPGFAKGRCRICYNYRRKFGRDRSKARIEALYPLGWCDCGQVAMQQVEVGLGGTTRNQLMVRTLCMCDACAAIENEVATVSFYEADIRKLKIR